MGRDREELEAGRCGGRRGVQGTSLTGFYLQRGGGYDGNDPSHRLPTEGYTDVTFPCNCFLRGGGRVSPSFVVFF